MTTRQLNRLSARKVATLEEPGRHADGGGLYLSISKDGQRRRWVFLFRWQGRLREMGLGTPRDVPLARAREAAARARDLVAQGTDPLAIRQAEAAVPTFGVVADAFVEAMKAQWRNEKHVAQWQMTLREYAALLRDRPVDGISTDDVVRVLKPIWLQKPETASRLRGRIERVLDAAKAQGLRAGENPARWRGHLDLLLPKRTKLSRGHHKAMAYADVPAFVQQLRGSVGIAARALEFTILTAARSGETLGAQWSEVDWKARVWIVPAARMKAGREHRVPLSDRALAILSEMQALGLADNPFVFPGQRPGKGLSVMALEMVMRRAKRTDTPHGFRSAFRDWAGEETPFPREVAEAALAHLVGDAVERAYRRGDALEKRRQLMEAWANFCDVAPGFLNDTTGDVETILGARVG
ncbi:tyrosine-type recombinase/integrase [Methylobacterium sp. SyP6R]|uniref:tyrosine-type recombinase/integrase n=1 Tax=Methylobacterium sp. SyP6R TaxID=2718876 RepID=UPI001F1CECB1|nr:site-specific integrase [Methylobacterium sp. SyP6R]MCF4124957.1 integrase arm-type DNA-binding domain-containing protein [Methylobacterium sp. SyP6R]